MAKTTTKNRNEKIRIAIDQDESGYFVVTDEEDIDGLQKEGIAKVVTVPKRWLAHYEQVTEAFYLLQVELENMAEA